MKKILLAIASDSVRESIHFALSQINYQVNVTDNGQDALNIITEGGIELLISSEKLPIIDGLNLSSLLREHVQNRFTPVLLLLDESISKNNAGPLYCNISSTLNIPFNMDELLFKIEKLLPAQK